MWVCVPTGNQAVGGKLLCHRQAEPGRRSAQDNHALHGQQHQEGPAATPHTAAIQVSTGVMRLHAQECTAIAMQAATHSASRRPGSCALMLTCARKSGCVCNPLPGLHLLRLWAHGLGFRPPGLGFGLWPPKSGVHVCVCVCVPVCRDELLDELLHEKEDVVAKRAAAQEAVGALQVRVNTHTHTRTHTHTHIHSQHARLH